MESTKFNEQFRKVALKNDEINLFKDSFVIVPYQTSGFIDISNRGFSDGPVNPEDFETFKRVWTGNDAFVIQWKKSINLVQQPDNTFKIEYSLGEVFLGLLETNDNEGQVNQDESFSEYKTQQNKTSYTFRVSSYFEITDYYQFMFFKIPELSKSTLFRISNIEKDFAGTKFLGYVITFESLNQDLANSGKARQQNVMPSAPGQGYLECIVEQKDWPDKIGKEVFDKLIKGHDYYPFFDRYIIADRDKTRNRPVHKVVVKCLGNGTHTTFVAVGRPAKLGDNFETFRPQRLLFPIKLEQPETYNFYRTQENTNNLYWLKLQPTLQYYKELMSLIKDSFTPVNQWKYEGFLQYSYAAAQASNPDNDKGHYKFDVFGFLDSTTNPVTSKPWTVDIPQETIRTTGMYGMESGFKIGGNKPIWDHMFQMYWICKMYKVLPTDIKSTVSFGWTLSSALGAAISGRWYLAAGLFAVGIAGTLISKLHAKKLAGFYAMISAPLLDYNNGLFSGNPNKCPFNMLDNNQDETPNSVFFSGSTLAIMYEAQLTDKIWTPREVDASGNKKILSTINIGQSKDENGEWISPHHRVFELTGDETLVDTFNATNGFIIDSFKICGIFNGEYSVEFLDVNDEVVWNGVYQSEGKWTKSMREIWTEKDCSVFGRENTFFTEPLPYPERLPDLIPDFPDGVEKTIYLNVFSASQMSIPGGGNNFGVDYDQAGPGGGVWEWHTGGGGFANKATYSNVGYQTFILMENCPREYLLESYKTIEIVPFKNTIVPTPMVFGANKYSSFSIDIYQMLEENESYEYIIEDFELEPTYSSGKDHYGTIENRFLVAGPLFVPESMFYDIKAFDFKNNVSITKARVWWEDDTLFLTLTSNEKFYVPRFWQDQVSSIFNLHSNPLKGYWILYGSLNTTVKAGLEKVIIHPR